jgi:hypothetical protein
MAEFKTLQTTPLEKKEMLSLPGGVEKFVKP